MKKSIHFLAAVLTAVSLLLGPAQGQMRASTALQTDDAFPAADWAVNGADFDSLGEFVSAAGDVNGDGYADLVAGTSGGFRVFLGGADGPAPAADFTSDTLGPGGFFFATTASGVGDVNGDGFDDLGAGAAFDEDNSGVARVYYGSANGFSRSDTWQLSGEQAEATFGSAVTGAGDVNGDGFADVLISAPGSYDATFPGQVYLFLGGEEGLDDTPVTTLTGKSDGDGFGDGISGAGDVNGDGFADALIRDPNAAVVYLYLGAEDGLQVEPAASILPEEYDFIFGDSIDGLGDVNGDGFDDVLVDAINIDETIKAYVYYGSAQGLDEAPDVRLVVDSSLIAHVGELDGHVASVGDLNGDGYGEVAISAIWPTYQEEGSGTIFLYRGGEEGMAETPYTALYGTVDADGFGAAVAGAGDVNGDGLGDLLVGAPDSTVGGDYAGKVYLFTAAGDLEMMDAPTPASSSSWTPGEQITLEGEPTEAYGWPAIIVRDMNGDGFDELVVNSIGNPDDAQPGHVELYWGSADGVAPEPDWRADAENWGLDADSVQSLDKQANTSFFAADVGDINGDGLGDLGVTIVDFVNEWSQVIVYAGDADELPSAPTWQVGAPITGTLSGLQLYSAGDVNGDGFDDMAMLSLVDSGNALYLSLYHGGEDGPAAEPAWTYDNLWPMEDVAVSFAALGDINLDGFDDVLVGSPNAPADKGNGEAYLFTGSADGLSAEPVWTLQGETDRSQLGVSVAALGDVNGDGASDFAISEYGYNNEQGRVHIFWAEAGDLDALTSVTLEGEPQAFVFGLLTAAAGDINGDGYDDLFVGSIDVADDEVLVWQLYFGSAKGIVPVAVFEEVMPFGSESIVFFQKVSAGNLNGDAYSDFSLSYFYDRYLAADEMEAAKAVVYLGAEGAVPEYFNPTWPPLSSTMLSQTLTDAGYGWPAQIVGDVNGDGYDDLAVNTFGNPDGGIGSVQIHHGGPDGVAAEADWQMNSEEWPALADEGTATPFSIGAVGDVNGDGFDDVAITLVNFMAEASRVLLYHGGEEGLEMQAAWDLLPTFDGEIVGIRVLSAGDANGDGFGDVVLVSMDEPNNLFNMHFYAGGVDGLAAESSWNMSDIGGYQDLLVSAAALGDVNGDGFGDLLIGQPYLNDNEEASAVEIWLGSADGLAEQSDWLLESDAEYGYLGASVAALGDVNGDGFADFAVSEPGYNKEAGQVRIYYTGADGIDDMSEQALQREMDGGLFGLLVFAPGDVNGDGFADLLTGSIDEEGQDSLLWQLYAGGADGVIDAPVFAHRVPVADELFVLLNNAVSGDLNGDGYTDLVFSDVDMNAMRDGEEVIGNVMIYYGGETE